MRRRDFVKAGALTAGVTLLGGVENMSGLICPCCATHIELFPPVAAHRSIWVSGLPRLGTVPLEPVKPDEAAYSTAVSWQTFQVGLLVVSGHLAEVTQYGRVKVGVLPEIMKFFTEFGLTPGGAVAHELSLLALATATPTEDPADMEEDRRSKDVAVAVAEMKQIMATRYGAAG